MNIDMTSSVGGAIQQKAPAPEQIDTQRKNKEKAADSPQSSSADKRVQSEELLSQIKAVTEDGLYSVRFEQNDNADLIVKIFDQKTNKMVRQIPAEEVLNLQKALEDLRGNIVDTQA
ncbi:MAG: flagellar protein FlaG [Proteobacteria bacterium]|nr:flagellar protein FlaG [Pseudomonadota bacterium]MBU1649812.1 flagellar protein FlaG [Pseudomonadota bacterium]MBU1986349.1 flagellar protein FlaG [Pseudomonadota bacterium]